MLHLFLVYILCLCILLVDSLTAFFKTRFGIDRQTNTDSTNSIGEDGLQMFTLWTAT